MFWFQLVVVLLLLAAVGWLAVGGGGHMSEPVPDRADLALPGDRPVAARDLDRVRFSVGLRGYRMEEVDDVLDRLAREVEVRDRRIAELEGHPYGDAGLAAASVDEALAAGFGGGDGVDRNGSRYAAPSAGSAGVDADAKAADPAAATDPETGLAAESEPAAGSGSEPGASTDRTDSDLPPLP